ncbi:MAG: DUF2088 domain-containing protein [Thermomicrobiales bacterium]|jgi:hypothetical protein|nr:DUF2088 domain-containing protein [Thermomicrobiales bacterium]
MSLDGLNVFIRGELPRWRLVRQELNSEEIGDVAAAVAAEFAKPGIGDSITPGATVAITCGSRGVHRIAEITKAIVDQVRVYGGDPFIVPAMGSHGGATAEGQRELIAHYGVVEEAMGCQIRSSMETVLLGEADGDVPVYFDKNAYEADIVIPVGRIKPHTDFHGPIESGLMKMISIGLGKQKGADTFHGHGFPEFHRIIPAVGRFTISHVNMAFGIGIVENGHSHLSLIEAIPGPRIHQREIELLRIARERMGRLPGERIDVLFVDQIGKDISGDGADPNVINRDVSGELLKSEIIPKPEIHRVIFRDLTPDTEGNATGVGLGDFVLKQLADKVDPVFTYMNVITSKYPAGGRMPMVIDNDRQALYLAIGSAMHTKTETARIARIPNTKDVEHLWISEPLWPELEATGKVTALSDFTEMPFDERGMLPAF